MILGMFMVKQLFSFIGMVFLLIYIINNAVIYSTDVWHTIALFCRNFVVHILNIIFKLKMHALDRLNTQLPQSPCLRLCSCSSFCFFSFSSSTFIKLSSVFTSFYCSSKTWILISLTWNSPLTSPTLAFPSKCYIELHLFLVFFTFFIS